MITRRLKTDLESGLDCDRDGRVDAARVQAAIDAASAEGGGRVVLEPGKWVCSTIFMRSHVELHLARGCELVADTDLAHYTPVLHHASNKDQSRCHLIVAADVDNIALTGPGVIEGRGDAFWVPCNGEDDRPYGIFRFKMPGHTEERPTPLIELAHCRDVVVDAVTMLLSSRVRSRTWFASG